MQTPSSTSICRSLRSLSHRERSTLLRSSGCKTQWMCSLGGKRSAGQLSLDGGSRTRGVVERACEADLRELRLAGTLPPGTAAIQAAYRSAGREVDRAKAEGDRWGEIGASRELRALREQLGLVRPQETTGERAELLTAMSAEVHD